MDIGFRKIMMTAASAVVLAAAAANAQDPWVKQSPFPADTSLTWAAFPTPERGFVVGRDQVFMRTLDGGETWEQIPEIRRDPAFNEDPFYNVFFLDEMHGWVIGNNNDAWRTTDGGMSWSQMTNHPAGSYYHLEFMTPDRGWTAGNGSMVRTDDGGLTWDLLFIYTDYGNVFGMDFISENHGAMVTYPFSGSQYPEGLYVTDDAGDTWSMLRPGGYNSVALFDADTILAVEPGVIFRSGDGGQSWSTRLSSEEGFSDVITIDETSAAALGLSGSVWMTYDAGLSWQQTHEGVGVLPEIWGASFTNSQLGFLAGPGGWLFRTEDGGQTWVQINNGLAANWIDVEMFSPMRGYAVGGYGSHVTWTHDGGQTWRTQVLEVTGLIFGRDESLESVSVVDRDAAFVGGNGGIVFKTLDGGDNWESIGYPDLPSMYINKVDFVSRDVGWVMGQAEDLTGAIYKTTNGGRTWINQDLGFGAIYGGEFFDENNGWFCTGGDHVFKTTDGGQTWTPYETPFTFSTPNTDVAFAPNNRDVGWVLQALDTVKRTEDGGNTWTIQTIPGLERGEWPLDISILSDQEAWIVINYGKMYHTTNGGRSWQAVQNGHTSGWWNGLSAIHALPTGEIWTVGPFGLILVNEEPTAGIELSQTELRRGQPATFTVFGAVEGEVVYYLYSFAGVGNGPCIGALGGLCLDLLQPITNFGDAIADADGTATLMRTLPNNAPLREVHTQAVIRRGTGGRDSVKSNTVTTTIQP